MWMPPSAPLLKSPSLLMLKATLTPNQSALPGETSFPMPDVNFFISSLSSAYSWTNTHTLKTTDGFMFFSVSLPEKLEHFANKYGEHLHEKWSAEKVRHEVVLIFLKCENVSLWRKLVKNAENGALAVFTLCSTTHN